EPIKIGFSMALTGGLAPNGKSALLAQKIWEEDVNAKGGLLGRPVKLIYYDDKSSPAEVPADLHEAARHRQSRSDRRALCDCADRAGHADRDPKEENLRRPARPRSQQRVQLSELFLHDPVWSRCQAGLHQGLLRCRHGAASEAADGGDHFRRPGIL